MKIYPNQQEIEHVRYRTVPFSFFLKKNTGTAIGTIPVFLYSSGGKTGGKGILFNSLVVNFLYT